MGTENFLWAPETGKGISAVTDRTPPDYFRPLYLFPKTESDSDLLEHP